MFSGTELQHELQSMELVAFTTPSPELLILTLVEKGGTGRRLMPLPPAAVAYVRELLSDNTMVKSMSAITVPDTDMLGFTAEVLIPPAGGVVRTVTDGE